MDCVLLIVKAMIKCDSNAECILLEDSVNKSANTRYTDGRG